MKLYRVTLQGLTSNPTGTTQGVCYVIAEDPTAAHNKVRGYLDEKEYDFSGDIEMDKIELIADTSEPSACRIMLFP